MILFSQEPFTLITVNRFAIVLLAIDAIDVIDGAGFIAVITVPYQPEWCRSKLILSL